MSSTYRRSLSPIPGTGAPTRGLFVSRMGGLLERPSKGPLRSLDQAVFRPRALDILFRASEAGWNIYLIGNEDAVARGRLSDAAWQAFETKLLEHVRAHGVRIKRHYACLEHPAGKGVHKKDSVFLFPNTGALYHAAQEDGIVLRESWLMSDDPLELIAGWRAGAHIAALEISGRLTLGTLEVEAEVEARDLLSAVSGLLAREGSLRR
jgi:histidinol phosphatase-like enzyme